MFTRTGAESTVDATPPLLAVGESAGVAMPYGCRRGICFGCLTPLTYGRVRDLRTGEVHERTGQMIQTCVSAAAGPLALDAWPPRSPRDCDPARFHRDDPRKAPR
ncbi:2Fe-2S iron-sulfur cluster-binding protein [Streptomyces spectabilis]|uniref:2Fe-2S ferredoxin-type domain-containing protein n=1 Tax=Streptomyces spectabilis TaxID=68270 RepID=A0A5P2XIX5_STRST|nr:hypothetical protein CP982_36960 [Streptomyces spectabilis]